MSHDQETAWQIDLELLDRVNRRRVQSYPAAVPDLVAERLFERLVLLKSEPARLLDLGAGDGRHIKKLQQIFPAAMVYAADLSESLLRRARTGPFWRRKPNLICLDAVQLPFADESIDLIVSNLMLPWVHPPDRFATELQRVLSPTGAFFLSTAGPDTLIELRRVWAEIDESAHVNMLLDMHDVGDVLQRVGIADPVMDAERLQIEYPNADALLDELIAAGCLSVMRGRRAGLMGRDIRRLLKTAYPLNDKGGVTANFEVVYAHGWKGQPAPVRGADKHEFYISPDVLRTRNS